MDNILNKRLKELRIKYGYKSQQALADAISVDRSLVKSWERENTPVLPRLDNLIAMCKLYNCDLDYLVGTMKEQTHDIKTACELTGLSEAAIEKISKGKPFRTITMVTLSKLIETDGFSGLILAYRRFLESTEKLKESTLETTNVINDTDTVVLSRYEATKFYMQEVANNILFICGEQFQKQYQIALANEQKRIEEELSKTDDIESGDE